MSGTNPTLSANNKINRNNHYSVFSASAGALLLAVAESRRIKGGGA